MRVWVASANTAERALIVAALAEEGLDARGFESLADLMAGLASGQEPQLIVLDGGLPDLDSATLEDTKRQGPHAKTMLISGSAAEPFAADVLLRRPLSIGELTREAKRLSGLAV